MVCIRSWVADAVAANFLIVSEMMKIGQLKWLTNYCVFADSQRVSRYGRNVGREADGTNPR